MSPLLPFDLPTRRALVDGTTNAPFAALADSLTNDLEPWLAAPLSIPADKARLTRAGGRCPVHGTFLDFNPAAPHDHWCARCEQAYTGRVHDQWWAMGAHLWTAERAVHAAALFALRGDARHAALAAHVLRQYADHYTDFPNNDNVLGPSRLFFSTYLEAIWLLNLCHAVSLLERASVHAPQVWSAPDATRVRHALLAPAADIVASYDEGGSNRQVWNEAAISSAWLLLGRERDVRARFDAPHGLRWQLAHGLDDDGFWYEGENYHLFAHRGLWYGVQLLRALNEPLDAALEQRYARGFLAPFAGLLPDETFPSRRDSQYASSIRQWRTAEWCELGWAHTHDARIASVLTRVYDGRAPRRDTRRANSTADAERNTPPAALTRADLSWRALLMADPQLPIGVVAPLASVVLPTQGLAVIRRDLGRQYVALEGGACGGGHGHPDQLALTLQSGDARWLEDPGTGSYVERELHWYRSTMAHMAPYIDGMSQHVVEAELVAFDDRGGMGWIEKRVSGIADGVDATRTIVVGESYVLDVFEWRGVGTRSVMLPIAGEADVRDVDGILWRPKTIPPRGTGADDDPVTFLLDLEELDIGEAVALDAYPAFANSTLDAHQPSPRERVAGGRRGEAVARVWYAMSRSGLLGRSVAPDAPGRGVIHRHVLEVRANAGRIVGVWSLPTVGHPTGRVSDVVLTPADDVVARITTDDGTTAVHSRAAHGWHVELLARGARSSIDLEGLVTSDSSTGATGPSSPTRLAGRASDRRREAPTPQAILAVPVVERATLNTLAGDVLKGALTIELGGTHYRRTEPTWHEAGEPTATIQMGVVGPWLVIDVTARTGPVKLRPPTADALDNEHPDINLSGLQWYIARADIPAAPTLGWFAAGLHAVSDRQQWGAHGQATTITGAIETPTCDWREIESGWSMRLKWKLSSLPIDATGALDFDVVVNDCPPDRERRRGQLVLSGGGDFCYLAGNRRPTNRFVRLQFPFGPGKATL